MDNIHECSTYYPIIGSGRYHTYILDSNHCTSEGYVHNYILYNYIHIRNIYAQIRKPSLLSQVYPLESYNGGRICVYLTKSSTSSNGTESIVNRYMASVVLYEPINQIQACMIQLVSLYH